jgi:hypothetical protein
MNAARFLLSLVSAFSATVAAAPITLHPDNPHYFLFHEKPAVLITSGEHYGAVLNLDFDFKKYLDTLAADTLNNTRTFSGAYVEPAGAFNIASNTLAPVAGRFICPWARSVTPGYASGGNKFDLSKWDDSYFKRLREFVGYAEKRGVIVEMNLFCPFYEEKQWKISPMNAINNINDVGNVGRTNVYTLDKHGGLLPVQEEMVRKIVRELNAFDNLYYEICNEAYFAGVTLDWQHRIAEVIVETEKSLPQKHLISRNVANGKAKIDKAHPAISIYNFHYASPPDTVGMNYGLNKVIGDNETGFKGTNDTHYRMEGWEFILSGGALYNNLDYSFTAGHEDGTFVYPKSQPGGGNPAFRKQLKVLKEFIESFEFVKMKPAAGLIQEGLPAKGRATALIEEGRQYAVYFFGGPQVKPAFAVPAGKYLVEWLNPLTGECKRTDVDHAADRLTLESPAFDTDVVLKVVRRN